MKEKFLTLEELAAEVGRSVNTLKKHFDRTKANLAKKGIIIQRYGTGDNGKYTVEYRVEE
jgi:predicted transcriptional regulator